MKQTRNALLRLLPDYAWPCVLLLIAGNAVAYYLPKALDAHRALHLFSTPLDDALPLVPGFILIYVLAYVQWTLAIGIIFRDSRERCFRFLAAILCAMLLAMLTMLAWPTVITRPHVEVRDLPTWLLAAIYRMDEPSHVFPSMHCLFSWFCFRGSLGLRRMPRWYALAQGGFSLLVFASVVLVKQHAWPDILGGIAAAELGIAVSRPLRLDRRLERWLSAVRLRASAR